MTLAQPFDCHATTGGMKKYRLKNFVISNIIPNFAAIQLKTCFRKQNSDIQRDAGILFSKVYSK